MVVPPSDVTAVRLLTHVALLVNPKLGLVRKRLPTVLAGNKAAFSGHLMSLGVFSHDMVLKKTVFFSTDGAEMPLTAVYRPVASQVVGLRESLATGVTPVRSHVLVHQLVSCQVTEMIKALSTYVTNERLVRMCHLVRFQHTGTCVTFPTDVTMKGLFTSVPHLHVQVTVSLVVESLCAVITGVWQQPVLFNLVLAELHYPSKNCPAH